MQNIELLRSLMVQGLLGVEEQRDNYEFKSWLSSGQYLLRDVPSSKEMHIEITNEYAFNRMLAYDSCRMATAAFETMESIRSTEKLPRSYGWIAVKSYYAAFFSAHSIMRCFGCVCSQLERGHVRLLNDFCNAVGINSTMSPVAGFFTGVYEPNSRIFTLKKMSNTHEDTWFCFSELLNLLSQQVLTVSGVTAKKQELSANIDTLVSMLKDGGRSSKGNYLSKFRNSVNYRQEYSSWYPYGKGAIRSEKILSLVSSWRNENIPVSSEWKESKDAYNFFYCCAEVINLCHKIISLIIENSSSSKNLFNRWPNKFLKLTAAA